MESDLSWMGCAALGTVLTIIGFLTGLFSQKFAKRPPIYFGKPEAVRYQDFLTWWHIPVHIKPRFFHSRHIDSCAVSVAFLKYGKVEQRIEVCWQTDEGPERIVDLEPKKAGLVPIAIRSVLGQDFAVFPDGVKLPPFVLPGHEAVLTDSAALLGGEISLPGLASRDYVMRLEIRRRGKMIKKSNYYVLSVPQSSADNRNFDLHL